MTAGTTARAGRFSRWQCLGAAWVMALACFAPCGSAWAAPGTEAHWGGRVVPEQTPSESFRLQMLGWTAFGRTELNQGRYPGWQQVNHQEQSFALNTLSFHQNRQLRLPGLIDSNLYFDYAIYGGIVSDATSYLLQNRFVHQLAGLPYIPRGPSSPTGGTLSASATLNLFLPGSGIDVAGLTRHFDTPWFIGGGMLVGTTVWDTYVHAGISKMPLNARFYADAVEARFSLLARLGMLPTELASPWENTDLADAYWLTQGALHLTFARNSLPIGVTVTLTGTSGAFAHGPDGQVPLGGTSAMTLKGRDRIGIPMYFVSAEFDILRYFVFETYNDLAGGTDIGPSWGAQISYKRPN